MVLRPGAFIGCGNHHTYYHFSFDTHHIHLVHHNDVVMDMNSPLVDTLSLQSCIEMDLVLLNSFFDFVFSNHSSNCSTVTSCAYL
jgi:hypothetical protein